MAFADEDLAAARDFLRKKEERREAECRELWQRAAADAEAVKRHIIERYNPRRILQWGSVLRPEYFREFSDIDFAVEGVSGEVFWEMYRTAEELTRFPLHLLHWEFVPEYYQRHLLLMGKVVYERS